MPKSKNVPVSKFSKDHLSLLLYVENLQFESKNKVAAINLSRMRCNPKNHPLHHVNPFPWKDSWGTKLNGFFNFEHKSDIYCAEKNGFFLTQHDDWDCLEDLEKSCLVEIISFVNGFVTLTTKGIGLSSALRVHKNNGGNLSDFDLVGFMKKEVNLTAAV